MKKLLLLFTLLLAFSCTKQEEKLVTIRFEYVTESGVFPTKAIADEIMGTIPSTLSLTLTDSHGKEWSAVTGGDPGRVHA